MNNWLENKVVIVTGASSGIGAALAFEALMFGAKVSACARDEQKLKKVFSHFPSERILCVQADVSLEEDCRELIKQTLEKFQSIDILINNAGISMRAMFEDVDLSVIKKLMDINFWGAVNCTKFALPYIKINKGSIIGISSIAGFRGLPARTGYSSSKFALQGFLESLRTELLHTGVNVMWASPGFTASNIRNNALNTDGNSQKETPLNEEKLMSAEDCAHIIWQGIRKRKRIIIMTTQGKLTVWLNKLFPKLVDKLVYNHFAKEPDSPLK